MKIVSTWFKKNFQPNAVAQDEIQKLKTEVMRLERYQDLHMKAYFQYRELQKERDDLLKEKSGFIQAVADRDEVIKCLFESATKNRPHVSSEQCWCEPELNYVDPDNGAEVWVHRELQ